jgi:hypothetical protein
VGRQAGRDPVGPRTVTYRYNKQAVDESWKLILDFIKRRIDGAR